MNNLIKLSVILISLTTFNMYSNLSLYGDIADQLEILEHEQYPADATSSDKTVTFVAPTYHQDMYLFLSYLNEKKYQLFDISDKHELKITLLTPSQSTQINVYIIPKTSIEKYKEALQELVVGKEGLSNKSAVHYILSQTETQNLNAQFKALESNAQWTASLDFKKLENDDRIKLLQYKPQPQPMVETAKSTPLKPLNGGLIKNMTVRIPEQDINFSLVMSQ